MAGQVTQITSWTLTFDGLDFSGSNGGLAEGDAIKLSAPEATPAKLTVGASGDIIATRDVQSLVRKFIVRVINGLYAYTELQRRAFAQIKGTPGQGGIPVYNGTITQATTIGTNVQITEYPFVGAIFSTFPDHTIKNANADPSEAISEFELEAGFISNQLN